LNRCSFCGEPIAVGTAVCRWCGRRQPGAQPAGPKARKAAWQARAAGWLGRYNRELVGAGLSLMAVAVLALVWVTVTRMTAQAASAAATPVEAPAATLTAVAQFISAATATPHAPVDTGSDRHSNDGGDRCATGK
jgi:hypothetical protein